jgi:hypothetical protein
LRRKNEKNWLVTFALDPPALLDVGKKALRNRKAIANIANTEANLL